MDFKLECLFDFGYLKLISDFMIWLSIFDFKMVVLFRVYNFFLEDLKYDV